MNDTNARISASPASSGADSQHWQDGFGTIPKSLARKQATIRAAVVLLTLWVDGGDVHKTENSFAKLLRALDTLHLGDPTRDDEEVLACHTIESTGPHR